jgi:hypothetical protein
MGRRRFVAIFTAYALLLMPLFGAMTAYAPGHGFALCTSSDSSVPANTPSHACCLFGVCTCAAPASSPVTAAPLPPPVRAHAAVAARGIATSYAEPSLAAPPRGPPPHA